MINSLVTASIMLVSALGPAMTPAPTFADWQRGDAQCVAYSEVDRGQTGPSLIECAWNGRQLGTDAVIASRQYSLKGYAGSVLPVALPPGYSTCNIGKAFLLNLNAPWNNVVSSVHTYAGCSSRQFDGFNQVGTSMLCQCASMSTMDNRSSSIRMTRNGSKLSKEL